MLPAVGGDQFGAALAAVPPVAGVADMLAAMMGGAASARPAFPGLLSQQRLQHQPGSAEIWAAQRRFLDEQLVSKPKWR